MDLLGQRDALVNQMNQMGTFILDSDRQNLVEFNIIINFCVYASDVNDPTEPGLFFDMKSDQIKFRNTDMSFFYLIPLI